MTVYEIEILLRIHRGGPAGGPDFPADICVLDDLVKADLIAHFGLTKYKILARGEAYIAFLQQMPTPMANWVIPGPWSPSLPSNYKPPEPA